MRARPPGPTSSDDRRREADGEPEEPPGGGSNPGSAPGLRTLLARGASVAFVIQVAAVGLQYGAQVLLARWMGSEDFGGFSFAFATAQTLGVLAAVGLPVAALRFIPDYSRADRRDLLRGFVTSSRAITLLVGLTLGALGGAAIHWLAPARPPFPALLAGMALIPLMGLMILNQELTRAQERVALAFTPPKVLLHVAIIAGAFTIHRLGGGLSATEGVLAVAAALVLVIGVQTHVTGRMVSAGAPRAYVLRGWLAVALPLLLVQESNILLKRTDIVMSGFFLPAAEVGYYTAATRTAALASFVLLAINAIGAPVIARLHAAGDHEDLQYVVTRIARWSLGFSALLALGLVLFADPILGLFGPDFVAARVPLYLLAGSQLVLASAGPGGHLLSLTGHHRTSAMIYGSTALLNIVLNLSLIPTLGMIGAAIGTSVSTIGLTAWTVRRVRTDVGVQSFAFGSASRPT